MKFDKFLNLFISLGLLLALTLPFFLTPSPSGSGTHEQLGLPACPFKSLTKIPCPSCGLTTSFTHLVKGNLSKSFETHPLGIPLYLVFIGAFFFFLYGVFRPQKIRKWIVSPALYFMILIFLAVGAGAWIWKLGV